MADHGYDFRTVLGLAFWSLVVGAILYWLDISPGDILAWIANTLASIWNWLANTGFQYILLGATVVIPFHLYGRARKRARDKKRNSSNFEHQD